MGNIMPIQVAAIPSLEPYNQPIKFYGSSNSDGTNPRLHQGQG